ncbi:uncharacterized protein PAN0_001c0229 [Moesziomyces antarcticus]|uniref:G-patch domain-containing protein n=1 Tax=Pseudozyma antarctica TaxID=84753 RepID=A0A5C3FE51_PSEA2|nr:uncharacterized protein PAN0_001c0229 [Moesziomyces antarcticus]GAK62032.1 conserved hypothetical protein [Moesziomyces antarcticus]SPO42560.1 uncharacterized protein PSANT_00243 [Moesziomyces antarcticus]
MKPRAGPSSGASQRFDPLKLLSEIQAEPTTSAAAADSTASDAGGQDADEDDDFMSNKFLVTSEEKQPLTYTDKRRRLEAHHARKTRKSLSQQEEEARQQGLDRDLLAEAEIVAGGGTLPPEASDGTRRWELIQERESQHGNATASEGLDGTSKAMKMMLAMGYRRGEALGRRQRGGSQEVEEEEEEDDDDQDEGSTEVKSAAGRTRGPPDDTDAEGLDTDEEDAARRERDDSDAREEDEYLTGGVSSAPFSLQTGPSVTSTGLTEPLRPDQRWLGLHRRAGIGMIPPTKPDVSAAILSASSSLRSTDDEALVADFRTRVSRAHQERHELNLLTRARKTLIDLDRTAGIEYSPLWLDAPLYHLLSGHSADSNPQTIDERMHKDTAFKSAVHLLQHAFSAQDPQQKEAHKFCNLDTKSQLQLVLDCLRTSHYYCLFCGCSYTDQQDLAQHCPGQSEDDHS